MKHGMFQVQCGRWALVFVLSLGITQASFGQAVVERAMAFGQAGDWDEALQTLLPQMTTTALQADAHSWYVLGFIQKELYKTTERNDADSPFRLEAVSSLQRAWELGPSRDDATSIKAALDFLTRSYLLDAIDRVDGFTMDSDGEVLALFGRYEALVKTMDPTADVSVQKADVYRYLGLANGQLINGLEGAQLEEEQTLFDRSVSHYEAALKLTPGNYSGLYNLAITQYNQGVRQLKRIDHETSMFELMEIQDTCVALFEQALSPMESAHKVKPERFETLKGLMTIHYALNQPEASERYRRILDGLNGKGR